MSELTHINSQGRARMVDVGEKPRTKRSAVAGGEVWLNEQTFSLVAEGKLRKGDVLAVAQVAGIMAAKRTAEFIPMCHPVGLTGVDLSFFLDEKRHVIVIEAEARCTGETGVEMEAMAAVTTAALTIYDMCKAVQRDISIQNIRLLYKAGGKSGEYRREEQ